MRISLANLMGLHPEAGKKLQKRLQERRAEVRPSWRGYYREAFKALESLVQDEVTYAVLLGDGDDDEDGILRLWGTSVIATPKDTTFTSHPEKRKWKTFQSTATTEKGSTTTAKDGEHKGKYEHTLLVRLVTRPTCLTESKHCGYNAKGHNATHQGQHFTDLTGHSY
eukprot:1290757-Amphidinium_carterae.1